MCELKCSVGTVSGMFLSLVLETFVCPDVVLPYCCCVFFVRPGFQVDRHLRKLDQELAKFKMELEADNAGITEILERRKITLRETGFKTDSFGLGLLES